MDITVNTFSSGWSNIFLIGSDLNRQPGIWINSASTTTMGFHVSFYDGTVNPIFNTNQALVENTTYSIEIYYDQTQVIVRVDDEIKSQGELPSHVFQADQPVYIGQPDHYPASDAVVTNLVIIGGNCTDCQNAYLSDITPSSELAGWGGTTAVINEWIGYTTMLMGDGQTYNKFLVIHPGSDADIDAYRTYPLDGKYERFTAIVGSARTTNDCDENYADYGSFSIEILVDDVQKYYRNGYGQSGYDLVDIDIHGAVEITIKTNNDGVNTCDHATIAGPLLSCQVPPG